MPTHRRYSFQHPGERTEGHTVVQAILEQAVERHWWYREPEVSGQPFARLVFSFTVTGRDQWWAHHRALKLATDCYYALGMSETEVPEPDWEPLEPHTNRGRWRRAPAASES